MQFLEEQDFLVGRVESSRVDEWCIVSKEGRPGAWVILFLMWWSHAAMDLSDWPHVDMVR